MAVNYEEKSFLKQAPGPNPIKILKHSDWLLKFFNQSECLKNTVA